MEKVRDSLEDVGTRLDLLSFTLRQARHWPLSRCSCISERRQLFRRTSSLRVPRTPASHGRSSRTCPPPVVPLEAPPAGHCATWRARDGCPRGAGIRADAVIARLNRRWGDATVHRVACASGTPIVRTASASAAATRLVAAAVKCASTWKHVRARFAPSRRTGGRSNVSMPASRANRRLPSEELWRARANFPELPRRVGQAPIHSRRPAAEMES